MKTRPSPLAGSWYPKDPHHLGQFLEGAFQQCKGGEDARGIVAPHAGYLYSGRLAACAYARFASDFDGTFIIIGPNHRRPLTTVTPLAWETPFGLIECDKDLVTAFQLQVNESADADQGENSLELQMPFVKYRFPRSLIAPILMGDQDFDSARLLAERILSAIRQTGHDVKLVASSDLSHFYPDPVARGKDQKTIEAILSLDVEDFYRRIGSGEAEACGYGPIATMCLVCEELGARRAESIGYGTSGDVTGDLQQVVGYGAIAVM